MSKLKELSLVNMPIVREKQTLELIEKSFMNHKSIEILNLSGNNLPNYDSIVAILENNKHIQWINVRGTPMSVDNLGYIWLGLRQNISLVELEFQREKVAFAFDTMQCVEIDLILNQEINTMIKPKVEGAFMRGKPINSLDLSDSKIQNIESVLKYIRLTKAVKSLDLSFTNLSDRAIQKVVRSLIAREINLNTLILSRNIGIGDEVCKEIGNLFTQRSTIKHLYLDDTSITQKGVNTIIESIAENLKISTLSFKNSEVEIYDPEQPEWNSIVALVRQNCSLIKLELDDNKRIDENFIDELNVELKKNKQIVDTIFPKLME